MTHVSVNISHQQWRTQTKRHTLRRDKRWWRALTSSLARFFGCRRTSRTRRSRRLQSLDQLSDHELRDIGLTRDSYGSSDRLHHSHTLRDRQYDRLRRLPGE